MTYLEDSGDRRALEAEALIESLFGRATVGFGLVSLDGHILHSNAALQQMLGYTGEELARTHFTTFTHPDDLPVAQTVGEQWSAGELDHWQQEKRYVRKDGRVIWGRIMVTLVPESILPDQLGLVMIEDMTGQKQVEDALRESERVYRALFDLSLDGVLLTMADGTVLDANPAACAILGMTAEEICARGRDLLLEQGPELEERLREREETGRVSAEVSFIRKDGSKIPTELTSVIIPGSGPVQRAFVVFRDISERRQAEAALRENERRYRQLVESAYDCVWETDKDGVYVFVSPAIHGMLGYEPEELVGKTPFDFMSPGEAARAAALFGSMAASGAVIRDVETISLHKDGHRVTVETSGSPVFDEAGKLQGYRGVTRDVTERRWAETAQEGLHQLLEKVAAQVPGALYQYRLSADGKATMPWASGHMSDVFELEPAEVRDDASPTHFRVHPDDRPRVLELIQESARTLRRFRCEYRVVLPRQGTRWHSSDALPERTEDGGTLWHGIITDITERKQVEEALREGDARYRQLLEAARVWVWEVDENLRYTYASDNVIDILGYSPQEIAGKTPFDLMPPEEAARMSAGFTEIAAGRGPFYDLENVNLHKEGQRVFLSTTGVPLFDSEGRLHGYRGMDVDVTRPKQAEEALRERDERLRQAQKMEAVGRLAGGIAHDFNNLLTVIIGYGDFLLSDPQFSATPWSADVRKMKAAAERAGGLTQQILAFSRRQVLQGKVVSISQLVEETAPLLRRTLGEDVELVTSLSSDVHLVEVDPSQFTQVLLNLAVNARDAMPVGGRLTFRTDNVVLDESFRENDQEVVPGEYVRLQVTDTGIGISAEVMPLIFEPFYTTKGLGEGTGLGLPTVYGVVKQSGGTITVASTPGEGTTFEVFLPRSTRAPDLNAKTGVHAGAGQAPVNVLLVEDEEGVRILVQRLLAQLGHTVFAAADGRQALAMLRSSGVHIDLLVTDVVLPGGMDGSDVARAARLLDEDLVVLFISGYSRNVDLDTGDQGGAVYYLDKPFTAQELADKLEEALSGQTTPSGSE